jgi:hypothetical protein
MGPFSGKEVKDAELATHYVPSRRLPQLEEALHSLGPRASSAQAVEQTLCSFEVSVKKRARKRRFKREALLMTKP